VTGDSPYTAKKAVWEEKCNFTLPLTSILDGGEWSTSSSSCFTPDIETRYPIHRRLAGLEWNLSAFLKQ